MCALGAAEAIRIDRGLIDFIHISIQLFWIGNVSIVWMCADLFFLSFSFL